MTMQIILALSIAKDRNEYELDKTDFHDQGYGRHLRFGHGLVRSF